MNPWAWQESNSQCKPIGVVRGQLALHQLQNRCIYLAGQPDPSGLFTEHPWPRVQARPRNIVQLVHQCMTGQRAADSRLIKKPTQFWTNSPDMAYALRGLICVKQHEHSHVEGADTRRVQLYVWQFVACIAQGCQLPLKTGKN
eukprot:169822-Lingulodinium_polyedra.AAC.1